MNILEEYVKYCDNIDNKESKMDSDSDDYGFYCDLEDIPLSTHKKFVKISKYTKNNKNNSFIPITYKEQPTLLSMLKNFENKDYNNMKQRLMMCLAIIVVSTFILQYYYFNHYYLKS